LVKTGIAGMKKIALYVDRRKIKNPSALDTKALETAQGSKLQIDLWNGRAICPIVLV
jgi:hypothetical protein